MRTLRSGKSLPESSLNKRRSLGAAAPVSNLQQEHSKAVTRRASMSAVSPEKEPLKLIITRRMSRSQDESHSSQVTMSTPSKRDRSGSSSLREPSEAAESPGGANRKELRSNSNAAGDSSSTSFAAVAEKMIKKMSPVKEDSVSGANGSQDEIIIKESEETSKNETNGGEEKGEGNKKTDEKNEAEEDSKKTPRKRRDPVIYDSTSTERLPKNEICEICGLGFTRKAALLRHSQSHVVAVPEPPPTPSSAKKRSVPKPTPSPSVASSSDGNPLGIITCEVCGIFFTRKAHLDRHMKLHTGERPYECDVCSLKFTRKDHMLSHRVKHTQTEKEHPCHYCKMTFDSNQALRDHVESQHLSDGTASDQHICEICGKQFLQRRYLQAHRKLHRLRGESVPMGHPSFGEDVEMDEEEDGDEYEEVQSGSVMPGRHSQRQIVMANKMVKMSADLAMKSRTSGGGGVGGGGVEGRKSSTEDEIELRYESPMKHNRTPSPARGQQQGQRRHECQVCGLCVNSIIELRKHYKIHKKRYICRFCGLRLASAGSLMRHNLLHTGKKEFGCDICGKKFSRKDTLAVHVQQHANKPTVRVNLSKPFLCKICGTRYAEKFKLIRHLKMAHSCAANTSNSAYQPTSSKFPPEFGEFPFDGQTDENQSQEDSLAYEEEGIPPLELIKTEPVDYRGDEEEEQNWETFEESMEGNGTNDDEEGTGSDGNADKNYQCDHCDKVFKNSKSLNTHKWYLAREKLFTCPICKRGFKYSTDLNRHITTHSNPASKTLSGRQARVLSSTIRPQHPQSLLLQGHQQRLPVMMPRGGINALEDRPYGCSICPQRFNHRSNLSRHVRLIHNGSATVRRRVPNSINLQNYLRKLNTTEPQKASMISQNHLQIMPSVELTEVEVNHEEQWNEEDGAAEDPAEIDNAARSRQEVLDRAAAIAEAQRPARGSVDHSLPEGSFTFDPNSSRPYICNPCGKSFENRSSLWTHMRIHNKSFTCSFCGLKTATHGDLVLHLRTHTGERPYKCSRCEWRFSRKSALNKHFRKYHSATSGRVLRPWVYREDRGNLKFKFVRSSPQRNDFEMRELRGQMVPSTSKMMARPLPKLTPNPNQHRSTGHGTILKTALQSQQEGEPNLASNPNMTAIFKCRKCGVIIHGKNKYIEHIKAHNTVSVSITPVNPSGGSSSHFNGRRDAGRFPNQMRNQQDYFECTICGKVCSTIGFLSRHYQYVHPNEYNPAEEARFRSHDEMEQEEEKDPLVPEVVMEASNEDEEEEINDGFGDPNIPPNTRPNYTVPLNEKDRILNRYNIDVREEDDDQDLSDSVPFPYNLARGGLEISQVIAPCPRCGKQFTNKKSRSDHVWYCNRKRMYLCPIPECRKGFKLKHDISRHMRRHMDDKRFSCQACPERFHRKMELHRHLRNRHDVDMFSFDYPCDFCDMEFKNESVYVTHLELAHSMDRNDLDGCGLDTSQGSNNFGFVGVGGGGNEYNEEEFDDATPDPTVFLEQTMQAAEEHPYECKPCKKVFPDRQKYMFHRYYHEREAKYPCTNCEERFKLRSHLERHIMTYHNALKPIDRIFKCEQCPRKFTREHDLVTHFNREHSNGSPMSVSKKPPVSPTRNLSPKRNVAVASTSQPQEHRLSPSQVAEKFNQLIEEGSRSGDSPEKNKNEGFLSSRKNSPNKVGGIELGADGMFHCDLCPKVFEEKKVADAHRYYHQREHKYSCNHCGAKFKQNSDLQRHNRIHHNPANRKRTMHCQQCFRSFTDKRYLRMHIKRYHSDHQGNDSHRKGMQSGTIRRPGGKPGTTASSHALNMAKLRMRNTRAYPSPAAATTPRKETPYLKSEEMADETTESSIPPEVKVEQQEQETDGKNWNEKAYGADFTIEAIEIEDGDENATVLESWGPESQSSSMPYDEDEEEITAIEEQEYMRDEQNSGEEELTEDPLAGTEDNFEMQCQGCNGVFTSEEDLNEHECYGDSMVEEHDTRLNGSHSSYEIGRRSMRGTPLSGRHLPSGVRPFLCDDCGKPFTQRIELNAHMQSLHGKAMEEYDCPFCPKTFLVKKSLDSHKRRHHGNIIQIFNCEYCGRQLSSHKLLETHLKNCRNK